MTTKKQIQVVTVFCIKETLKYLSRIEFASINKKRFFVSEVVTYRVSLR